MAELLVALAVKLPQELFPDEDALCCMAGKHICTRLESHLSAHGHTIPKWIRGGCEEDWGTYFESQLNQQRLDYTIGFFPSEESIQRWMLIQYGLHPTFWQSMFSRAPDLAADHPLHATMQSFGEQFAASRMLTKQQLDAEY